MAGPQRPAIRYLQANAGTECPSHLVFFDSETRWKKRGKHRPETDHKFRLVCATHCRLVDGRVTRETQFRSTKIEEFWEWMAGLEKPRQVLWAFAHNLAFDLQILRFWDQFTAGNYTCGPISPGEGESRVRGKRPWRGRMVWGSSPCFLYLMGRTSRVNLVDTYNYWRSSLSTAAKVIGTDKLPMPDIRDSDREWFAYCEQDVVVLKDLVVGALNHWRQLDGGVWQPTGPALSLQSFRHQELTDRKDRPAKKILLDDREEDALLEREGYYGGYFGAFYSGPIFAADDPAPFTIDPADGELIRRPVGPLFQIDCNGLYPFVMAANSFPFRRGRRCDGIKPAELLKLFPAKSATARVRISSLSQEFPVRADEHLLYMVGDYWTVLCGPELLRALKTDSVKEVRECCTYNVSDLFSRWVHFWHGERLSARAANDGHRESLAKLILNSLYGKFAQRGGGWINVYDVPSEGAWTQWVHSVDTGKRDPVTNQRIYTQHHRRDLGGQVQERHDGSDPAHAFPAISAHVSAFAREYMRDVVRLLPSKSCFYQGSDSLIINEEAMLVLESAGLLHPTELGHFKLDGQYNEGNIVAANHYRLDQQTTRSGTYGRARQRMDGSFFADIWEGAPSFVARPPDGIVTVTEQTLDRYDPYPKGFVQRDGWVEWAVHDTFFERFQG